ncbi:spike base protein, RCAP_Rcc01079 family [Ovoidimarina sediminis]|uniref:spike base protein, RCAP_Rcc01079 family n=1 Tax=Ovoidimarina sediminis TaxID=3079856 RepID=UPI00290B17C8|nr:hypothetical protein [Rhodophyticola sp. MJ-SS7]MDU8943278.1 hypothetical protein [Rhodophyticola sp. MJ-SS7]
MLDEFEDYTLSLTSPAVAAVAITPSDSTEMSFATRALYVGSGGDVTVKLKNGDVVTFRGLQAGVLYPLQIVQVLVSGTTASNMVGIR